MSPRDNFEYEEEERGFLQRYGFAIGGVVVATIVVVLVSQTLSSHGGSAPPKRQELVMIKPLPPPPTPPPPPPTPPPPEEKQQMVEQAPLTDEAKPVEQPVDQSPVGGTNLQGNGPPDGFGLSGRGNGFFNGGNSGRSGGSKYGWYASEVVASIGDALRRNSRTRDATFNLKARIWADATGRVTRCKLSGSTGDPEVDNAIKNEVLNNFQLKEPPPDGMPMPIVMRLSARRPQ